MDESPYETGYRHGRSFELFQPGLFSSRLHKTSYAHGYGVGEKDRTEENN